MMSSRLTRDFTKWKPRINMEKWAPPSTSTLAVSIFIFNTRITIIITKVQEIFYLSSRSHFILDSLLFSCQNNVLMNEICWKSDARKVWSLWSMMKYEWTVKITKLNSSWNVVLPSLVLIENLSKHTDVKMYFSRFF